MAGSHAHIFVTYRYLITCFSNDTSLLAVIRPYKNSAHNRAQENQLQKATGQNYAAFSFVDATTCGPGEFPSVVESIKNDGLIPLLPYLSWILLAINRNKFSVYIFMFFLLEW